MEGVYWYTSRYPYGVCICAEFDGRTRRVRLAIPDLTVQCFAGERPLVRHAVEQLTISIKEARAAAAQREEYAALH
jgi:hypothetical protein